MSVKKISVSLTEELNASIQSAVETGDYKSSSEVIREALREWQDRRDLEALDRAYIRSAIEEGLANGNAIPASKEMFDDFRDLIETKSVQQSG